MDNISCIYSSMHRQEVPVCRKFVTTRSQLIDKLWCFAMLLFDTFGGFFIKTLRKTFLKEWSYVIPFNETVF